MCAQVNWKKPSFACNFSICFKLWIKSSSKTEGLLQFPSTNEDSLYSEELISMLPEASRKTRGDERSFWPSSTVGDHSKKLDTKGPKTWGIPRFFVRKSWVDFSSSATALWGIRGWYAATRRRRWCYICWIGWSKPAKWEKWWWNSIASFLGTEERPRVGRLTTWTRPAESSKPKWFMISRWTQQVNEWTFSRLLGGKATLGDCITGHLNNIENVASERMVQQMQAKSDMKSKLQNW